MIVFLRSAPAADWYVATNGAGLGTSWADATNSLQGAINVSMANDTIWVSNGVYETGGVTNYPAGALLTNRFAIWKSITVRSKDNDPANTVIRGAWDPATTNGPAAVRCVYMASNSVLIGFTLTNGATLTSGSADRCGGGVYCPATTNPVLTNCVIAGNKAYGQYDPYYGGGGAWYGTLRNCTIISNSSLHGGGVYNSVLYNCALIGNFVGPGSYPAGGGVNAGTLYNCMLISNTATYRGGGASASTLSNCTLIGNSSGDYGGGGNNCNMYNCTLIRNATSTAYGGGGAYGTLAYGLYNCKLIGNSAGILGGGGALNVSMYNCILADNTTTGSGGGASGCSLYNCTVASNSAWWVGGSSGTGGGVSGGKLYNCIVYLNTAQTSGSNCSGTVSFTNTCTAPASNGWAVGNIAVDPIFIDSVGGNYRLAARSPCINAGTNLSWMTDGSVTSKDLDGWPRVRYGAVDMGAYENIRGGTVYGFR